MSFITATARRTIAILALTATGTGVGAAAATSASSAPASTSTIGTHAQIPWTSVTKGWVVAEVKKSGLDNLVMISPTGASYQITTLDGTHLLQVSADGKRALIVGETGGFSTLDLTTGKKLATITISDGGSFSKPSGLAVIGTNSAQQLVNRSATTGALSKTGSTLNGSPWAIVPNPAGTADVISTRDTVALFDHATLKKTRTFTAPSGYTRCVPQGFVDATHFRQTCVAKASMNKTDWAETTQVFTQSTTGGAPVAVTSGTYAGGTYEGIPLGFSGAWNTSKGTIAAPNVDTFSGSTRLFRVANSKVMQTYTMPLAADAAQMNPMVTTMVGTSAYVSSNLHEPGTSLAARYDVATGKVTYLAGAHSQYGGTPTTFDVID